MTSTMTCREFDEVIHGIVRMELLDVTVRESALDHAAICANCSDRMAEASVLADGSEALSADWQGAQTPARVEAVLMDAFRTHHRKAAWRHTFEWLATGAVAALVLMFAWSVAGPTRVRLSPTPKKDVSSQSAEPVEAKAASSSQSTETAQADETDDTSTIASSAYTASDFVPVPFTSGIAADDPGMVVRVQLTRASLAQLGYPVAEAPDEDLIRADVLVGEDGWPRGVKLVQ